MVRWKNFLNSNFSLKIFWKVVFDLGIKLPSAIQVWYDSKNWFCNDSVLILLETLAFIPAQ